MFTVAAENNERRGRKYCACSNIINEILVSESLIPPSSKYKKSTVDSEHMSWYVAMQDSMMDNSGVDRMKNRRTRKMGESVTEVEKRRGYANRKGVEDRDREEK